MTEKGLVLVATRELAFVLELVTVQVGCILEQELLLEKQALHMVPEWQLRV